ncbi:MAG: hypothetical protein EBY23_12295 [Actinobacteria bacterium]|nr:hypothetical protein [Actinomycetota bacterium]
MVTSDAMSGRKLEATLDWPWIMPRVIEAGIKLRTLTYVENISKGEVTLKAVLGGAIERIAVDTVVLSMLRESQDSLYHQLKARGLQVRRIGDCIAPREVDDAVLEGFREAHALS